MDAIVAALLGLTESQFAALVLIISLAAVTALLFIIWRD